MDSDSVKRLVSRVAVVVLLVVVVGPWLREWGRIPGAEFMIAESDRAQGRYDKAIEEFTALIKSNPADARNYAGRGDSYRRKGDRARAFADFDAALQREPRNFETYLYRCEARRAYGEIDAAIADCNEAALSRSERVEPLSLLGVMLLARGDVAAARAKLESAVTRQGDVFAGADSRIPLGQIALFYDNHPPEAATDFAAALKRLFEARSAAIMLGDDNAYVPSLIYLILWQHIARQRAGADDAQELAANLKQLGEPIARRWMIDHMLESASEENIVAATLRPWPGAILALNLGKITPEQLRAMASNAGTPELRQGAGCQADFYGGVYLLATGDRDGARQRLQAAADGCPATALEVGFAKAEIARIGT